MYNHTATAAAAPAALHNRRVLLTAPLDSSERMATLVQQHGGTALIAPLIERLPLALDEEKKNRLRRLADYQWIVFTSAGAVERFCDEIEALECTLQLTCSTIVAIGERTRCRIERRGYTVACVAEDSRAEGVIASMLQRGISPRDRVLFPSADNARAYLAEELRRCGIQVDVLELYTIAPHVPPYWRDIHQALQAGLIDALAFTSPSAVRQFFDLLAPADWRRLLTQPVICAIGRTTATALLDLGLPAPILPERARADDMIAALARHFSGTK